MDTVEEDIHTHSEDEKIDKCDALENRPTDDCQAEEVVVENLDSSQKKMLLDKLVTNDNEKLLLKIKQRFERVGLQIPKVEVRFEHLNIGVDVSVESRALPTVINFIPNTIKGILSSMDIITSCKIQFAILHDAGGIIKPGRMALLLGPPRSGKTTLLRALAGNLDPKLKFTGRVTYNGHDMDEFVPERTSVYISETDFHLAEMTVRETLAFSARCQGVGTRREMLSLCRREKAASIKPDPDVDIFMRAVSAEGQKENLVVDCILKILGLESCSNTIVGNQMKRGISGGQKKRLTAGEMLLSSARVFFMDGTSTGLDSSTTFQIINSLHNYIQILKGTAVISLLQPEPETYNLFDDIILLSDGHIVYQGPRENVLEFFDSMGFKCPQRKGVADFLQEVTSRKDQFQYWSHGNEAYHFITPKEFADAFKSFHVGYQISKELEVPFDKIKSHPNALARMRFSVDTKELLKACISREFLLIKRNSFVYVLKVFQLIFVGFMAIPVFYQNRKHKDSVADGTIFMASMFFTVTRMLFNQYPEILWTISKLGIFYKQRDLRFFPVWVYALPSLIVTMPIQLLGVTLWVIITYYVFGYDPDLTRFLKQFLLLVMVSNMCSVAFRFVGAIARNSVIGNIMGQFAVTSLFLFSGFTVSRENMKKWFVWIYWVTPTMYAQNGIAVNELLGNSWSHVLPNTTERLGVQVLKFRGLFPYAYWYWISLGAMFGFTVLFSTLYSLALSFFNSPADAQQFMAENTACVDNEEEGQEECNKDERQRGITIPCEKHFITFDEIRYSIDMPKEMRGQQGGGEDNNSNRLEILKGVSGFFRPGILTALMGVSGAGKTTLMDVLAGRKTRGFVQGDIRVSGYPKNQQHFARISGYCEQNDIHSPHITVYESLLFSAWLRLSPEISAEAREMLIEEVMELLELRPLRGTLIGLPGEFGLSIEQRKRVTVAVELVANPSLVFMDEPSSGLDARAAATVMRAVRNTVDTGRTVVCTIHQPSIDIFESFDELLLMKQGGQEIYVGPLGINSCHLIKYFEEIEGVPKIKDGCNPASWMLEVTTPENEALLGVDFAEIYRSSSLYRRNKALIQEANAPQLDNKESPVANRYSQPYLTTQIAACVWKQHWSYLRNPQYSALRLLFTAILALLLGSVFWDLNSNIRTKQDLYSVVGSMYSTVQFLNVQNVLSVEPVVAVERTVFYREKAAGMYSALPYALAQALIEVPYVAIQTVLFSVIVYPMMGFEWKVAKFLWYLFIQFFSFLYCTYFGMMQVALTPTLHEAAISSSYFHSVWSLFSGFLVPRERIPIWWRWNYWTCPFAWTMYALVVSQFGDDKRVLEEGITVAKFTREYFGYSHESLGFVAAGLVGFTVFYLSIFALAIKMINFQRR